MMCLLTLRDTLDGTWCLLYRDKRMYGNMIQDLRVAIHHHRVHINDPPFPYKAASSLSTKYPPRSPQRRTKQPNPRHERQPRRLYRPRRRPHPTRRPTPPVLAKLPDQNPIHPEIAPDHTRKAKRQHRVQILPRSHFVRAHQQMQGRIDGSAGNGRFCQDETRAVVGAEQRPAADGAGGLEVRVHEV
jgi:hypothetical protein